MKNERGRKEGLVTYGSDDARLTQPKIHTRKRPIVKDTILHREPRTTIIRVNRRLSASRVVYDVG